MRVVTGGLCERIARAKPGASRTEEYLSCDCCHRWIGRQGTGRERPDRQLLVPGLRMHNPKVISPQGSHQSDDVAICARAKGFLYHIDRRCLVYKKYRGFGRELSDVSSGFDSVQRWKPDVERN